MPEPPSSGTVQLVAYNPDRPRIFRQISDRLWPSLHDIAIAIEHVGSTSIPGMLAKPVIDVDVIINSRSVQPRISQRLAVLGYEPRGNLGIEDRDAFRVPEDQPPHHLYVCVENSLALRNHIALRDYLRSHPAEAVAYSLLKEGQAQQFANDRRRYGEAKTDFVLSILERCGFSMEELELVKRANTA